MNATSKANTFGVTFFVKRYKAIDDKAPVYARITVDGNRTDVSIKRNIDLNNWNGKKGLAKGKSEDVKELNKYLEQTRSLVVSAYQDLFLQRKLITAEAVKSRFLQTDQKETTLQKLIDHHNTVESSKLTKGTLKNYQVSQRYLIRFINEKYGKGDMYLSELSYRFIEDFEYYLRHCEPLDKRKPLNTNGIMKHTERLCKMLNMAVRIGWIDKSPFVSYKQKLDTVEIGFLTSDELATIENTNFVFDRLTISRDVFVFSCYTGLAYTDAMQLTAGNITTKESEQWLMTKRQKTGTPVNVPLLPKALAILEKYKGHPLVDGRLLPYVSNQTINRHLKEIAEISNVKTYVSFHTARHTFATTVTLSNGVPIETVSRMLGHTTLTMTQVYAKVIEDKVRDDMQQLKAKLASVKPEQLTPEILTIIQEIHMQVTGSVTNIDTSPIQLLTDIQSKLTLRQAS